MFAFIIVYHHKGPQCNAWRSKLAKVHGLCQIKQSKSFSGRFLAIFLPPKKASLRPLGGPQPNTFFRSVCLFFFLAFFLSARILAQTVLDMLTVALACCMLLERVPPHPTFFFNPLIDSTSSVSVLPLRVCITVQGPCMCAVVTGHGQYYTAGHMPKHT